MIEGYVTSYKSGRFKKLLPLRKVDELLVTRA